MSEPQYRALVGRDRLETFGPLIDVSFGALSYTPTSKPDDRITQSMLLDTGAQLTVVEEVLPQQLGIEPHRYRSILGIGGPMRCPVYMMGLSIALSPSGTLAFWQEVVAVPPAHEGRRHVGLLGRDAMPGTPPHQRAGRRRLPAPGPSQRACPSDRHRLRREALF